jgi:hypothetical protein
MLNFELCHFFIMFIIPPEYQRKLVSLDTENFYSCLNVQNKCTFLVTVVM